MTFDLKFTGRLYEYQKKALLWMLERESSTEAPGGFLCLDMGMGKTILTIATICLHDMKHTLIVVPKNILPQWVAEFEKFSNITPFVFSANDSSTGKITHEVLSAHRVVITPISTFSSMKKDDESELLSFDFDRIVIDEAHLIRNNKTKSYKLIKKIQSNIKWCLTGTPINKSQNDFKTLLEFMSIFNVTLSHAAKKFIYRVVKEDVDSVKIPELTIEDLRSDFETEDEQDIYNELVENGKLLLKAYTAYGGGEGRMRILEQLLRLRQAVTNAAMLPGGVVETTFDGQSTKLNMLRRDITAAPMEKTIVFVHWIKEIESVREMLKELGHESVVISGKVKMEDRAEAIERFSNDASVNFFIIQIEAGGVGLNLQAASRVYINSLAWNSTSELQAIARSHRIGQKKAVTVKRLVINNTIDDHIISVQQKKLSIAAEILNDPRIEKSLTSTSNKSVFNSLLSVFK
jgi:SNF2 family DNA or RNA helicase